MEHSEESPKDIHLLTTDLLLLELIAGRSVVAGENDLLQIVSSDTRAILNWYRNNSHKWSANLNTGDTEAVIDLVGSDAPLTFESDEFLAEPTGQKLTLVKVQAHRFAGLHTFGTELHPPGTFVYEPRKNVTLFEGANGSGKTSLANAITWGLTGSLIRSQRPPEPGPTEFACTLRLEDGVFTEHYMSSVTPMPATSVACPADGIPILADTWVELTFEDSEGNRLPAVRREQSRKANGKIVETVNGFNTLPVDPIALNIATLMPALLPYLSLGSSSELGTAVAQMTGLASLVDLSKHAQKLSRRISDRKRKELEQAAAGIGERYSSSLSDLQDEFAEYQEMEPDAPIPEIGAEDTKDRLEEISDHFIGLKSGALSLAKGELGSSFDPESKDDRDELEECIGPAIGQLRQFAVLPSIKRLSELKANDEERSKIQGMLDEIEYEAGILANLAKDPSRAERVQLYALIAHWRDGHSNISNDDCPVCSSSLEGLNDPVTGEPIEEHLAAAQSDRKVLSQTFDDWSEHWAGKLVRELPKPIASELFNGNIKDTPASLLEKGMIDELFQTEPLVGLLSSIRVDAEQLFGERIDDLEKFEEPNGLQLPPELSAEGLQEAIDALTRALAIADWRSRNREELRHFFKVIVQGVDGDKDLARSIGKRLGKLKSLVDGVAPLNKGLVLVERLEQTRKAYASNLERQAACLAAAECLDEIVPLGDLAQSQVDTLRTKLHNRSEHWRRAIFQNATDFAPALTGTKMDAKGVIELQVGRDGVEAPAHHIANASSLRAALLGFLLAFREHVLETRGGLATLVLDDPQELLDVDNRDRFARGLAKVGASGAQLIITSHDRKFARSLVAENRSEDAVEHLSVHPVNAVRPCLATAPAVEEVDRRRKEFRSNPDDAVAAQNYASDLRVFLEARLGDLFDNLSSPAYSSSTQALTLIPLLDKLRSQVSAGGSELFTNPVVISFANHPALAEGADSRRVLNESHHDKASITYGDVKAVESQFSDLKNSVEKVHSQFRFFRIREPLDSDESAVVSIKALQSVQPPAFEVQICPDLAAFAGQATGIGSQDVPEETIGDDWFGAKSMFYVRGETMGFSIPSGAVAIVDSESYPGRDQNLVIALYGSQVFARRLIKPKNAIGVSLLAQMPDPRTSRPSLTFDQTGIALHKVVGVVLTDMPPPLGSSEATQVQEVPELSQVQVAYRVKEDSAIPLALPGQTILGGNELVLGELDSFLGQIVAVSTSDGSQFLKRVGERLPYPHSHLRQFETIGGLGTSVILATETGEMGNDNPVLISARKVLGVLYE